MKVRILKDIPGIIIGADGKDYGPFAANDIADLPTENVQAWIHNGYAEMDLEELKEKIFRKMPDDEGLSHIILGGTEPEHGPVEERTMTPIPVEQPIEVNDTLEEKVKRFLSEIKVVSKDEFFLRYNLDGEFNSIPRERVETFIDEKWGKEIVKDSNGVLIWIDSLKIILDKDLVEYRPNLEKWIIEPYVAEKSIVMLGGKSSSYKTWSALNMAICIVSGLPLFNRFATVPVNVLYIDEENGIDVLKERVQKIKNGMGIVKTFDNLAFISLQGIKIDIQSWRQRLEVTLKEFKPKVIIVDCFRRIITVEENDATDVNKIFTDIIRPISEEFGVTWILVHHLRKGVSGKESDIMDELRGSSELANYVDTILIFQRPRRVFDKFTLFHAKSRRSRESKPMIIGLGWDEQDNITMEAIGTAEEILEDVDICAQRIMTWLEEENIDSFITKDVLTQLEDYSKSTIYRALNLLKEQHKLRSPKRGHYQKITENLADFSDTPQNQGSLSSTNSINSDTSDTSRDTFSTGEVSKSLKYLDTKKYRDKLDTDGEVSNDIKKIKEKNNLKGSIGSPTVNSKDTSDTSNVLMYPSSLTVKCDFCGGDNSIGEVQFPNKTMHFCHTCEGKTMPKDSNDDPSLSNDSSRMKKYPSDESERKKSSSDVMILNQKGVKMNGT